MEDYHVDRPGVEARQRVKLTGTNSSIELDRSHSPWPFPRSRRAAFACGRLRGRGCIRSGGRFARLQNAPTKDRFHAFGRPGGFSEAAAPDPIPNSAVKRLSANGTLSQGTGE